MSRYCCFSCPSNDYSEKSLDDLCPQCGRRYGFPLYDCPVAIKDYSIVKPLHRGFFAATYLAERGALNTKSVLKVSPQTFFDYFPHKNFELECRTHATVAAGTEHIVGIRDMTEAPVDFGSTTILCKIAELDYIEGSSLADYLISPAQLTGASAAQIAIDLFKILHELRAKGVNHNDLHAENIVIETLSPRTRRAQAVDDSLRVVAIDLGSVSDRSKSDSGKSRLGDLHWVADHLNELIAQLLQDPDRVTDLDNRLAHALQAIAQAISARTENQRTPAFSEFIEQIEGAVYRTAQYWRPWREPLNLKTFSASYNAQTMQAWHVPQLLVDPDGLWLSNISSPGPQVITGMRGCGKTMLLRALQFHARAAAQQMGTESHERIRARLAGDNYVGLFVSAQRLLDAPSSEAHREPDPFGTLFIAYGLEAVRALQHLRDVDPHSVAPFAYRELATVIAGYLEPPQDMTSVASEHELERHLSHLLMAVSRNGRACTLAGHPNVAFPALAEAIQHCATLWQTAQVLFLLDDVSTRYLHRPRIEELLSALLFQSPVCAFKLTSEAQTIELGLKSPGESRPARVGRDLNVFDLGAEVYDKIKRAGRGNGADFVAEILLQRKQYFSTHPDAAPVDILGDASLEEIALEIGRTANNSKDRKKVYRGITALARVCVGDIGDVIGLYEQILKRAAGGSLPVAAALQSDCFQDFCARRLYDLNRRGGFLKDVAKSFAEASHKLLVKSCKDSGSNGVRVRQYLSLYVRITTGDFERQTAKLLELIDAGVFVFAGGSTVPRTKTRDSNPTQQFKLTYRKIYGLVNFIGLAERDRFELSGSALEEWLRDPGEGAAVLLRHLGGNNLDDEPDDDDEGSGSVSRSQPATVEHGRQKPLASQISLFPTHRVLPETLGVPDGLNSDDLTSLTHGLTIRQIEGDLPQMALDCVVVGLGFEERALESARRLCDRIAPRAAVAVRYPEAGRGAAIRGILDATVEKLTVYGYDEVIAGGLPEMDGNVIVDVTGLAKPVIFHAVRNELRRNKRVWVCHTAARNYYPLNSDLEKVLEAEGRRNLHDLLEGLQGILTGEDGPYVAEALLPGETDVTRQRVLCAFSSSKHERLLSLLDEREFDRIEIVAPQRSTPRNRIAQLVAEVAARSNVNSNVRKIDSENMEGLLAFFAERYRLWYVDHGLAFEAALTGSKLQAVVCATASALLKVTQCWYLRPQQFDPHRFTTGVGTTSVFEISLPGLAPPRERLLT